MGIPLAGASQHKKARGAAGHPIMKLAGVSEFSGPTY
jgi:hypothetical protein